MRSFPFAYLLTCFLLTPSLFAEKPPAPPRSEAEKSEYKATTRHADVLAFCETLAAQSKYVKHTTFGASHEGRKLPLLVVADPPVSQPDQLGDRDRLVVLAVGNIHAGEVDGKEALLALARDLANDPGSKALFDKVVLLIVPNLNPDGNEKLGKHRPEQNGPAEVGTRANAQGLDLNRDFVKLETPEIRALVKLASTWDPAVVVDLHTTNGSFHRYAITYDGPRNPAGDAALSGYVRDGLLPAIGRRFQEKSKTAAFSYGNFSKDRSRWEGPPALPRLGIFYLGLRHCIGILSESYSYASFEDRVKAQNAFVRACLDEIVAARDKIKLLRKDAREKTVNGGRQPRGDDQLALRFRTVAAREPATILGFVEEMKDNKTVNTGKPKDYQVELVNRCEPTLTIQRPYAYLIPAALQNTVVNLQHHGVVVEELREDLDVEVEVQRIERLTKGTMAYQKHHLLALDAKARRDTRRVTAGTYVVRMAQPLGTLAGLLLEPQADDGLSVWNFLDAVVAEGKDYPILRLTAPAPLLTLPARSLIEVKPAEKKPITLEALYSGKLPNFIGSPVQGLVWLDDDHYLQTKDRQVHKVHAATGKATPFLDVKALTERLMKIPGMAKAEAEGIARAPLSRFNEKRDALLIQHKSDLWHCPLDGDPVRLTNTPEAEEELAAYSPDGKQVAFVRANNLYVVDLGTQKERALTKDGSDVTFNGKAGWVYFEEIFNRNWNAFWWSPDSKHLAFLRTDEAKLKKFAVVDAIPLHQKVEQTTYPKSGDPNPDVKLGIVPVGGGEILWAEVGDKLISRVGWLPGGAKAFFYLQNRTQTYLDFNVLELAKKEQTVLFRDATKAWIDDPGPPRFLKDGSFLWLSEKSGWKHIYRCSAEGKTISPVTKGEWEVQDLLHVDDAGGWAYFLGTKDSYLAKNLYRTRLDGTALERLTPESGDHACQMSSGGKRFIDTFSSLKTPMRVRLCQADGKLERVIDSNPVRALDEHEYLTVERVQVPTSDGFLMEGTILLPPNLDPKKKYPVWVKTYAGPHAPTVKDAWSPRAIESQAQARAGFIVFQIDPRSASGKGAVSAWTCYKQLGVQELKDLETAVTWLCQRPYVDAKRIGLSGHSYGGFITAYALTHSKLFAAGIAGAPVTDWHLYDTIYTERYMLTPKENADGYEKTSVVKAAKNLHGKLLLVHGQMDDNVHVQNAYRLVDALQKADKDFELMIYPQARHPIFGKHYRRLLNDFMIRVLKPEA